MRIILHIGNYKTGTSALQNFFHINKKKLERHGIYYGNDWEAVCSHVWLGYALLKEALEINGLTRLCPELSDFDLSPAVELEKMRFVASERGLDAIIISCEGLFADLLQVSAGIDAGLFEDVVSIVNDHIRMRLSRLLPDAMAVCYLRRQDFYLESMYNEYCKTPWRKNEKPVCFEEFLKKQRLCLDYCGEAEGWERYFGKNLFFSPYKKDALRKGDIIYDFLGRYFGMSDVEISEFDMPDVCDVNVGLSRDALEHKLLNKANDPLSNYLYKVYSLEHPDDGRYGFFDEERRGALVDKYLDGNRRLLGFGLEGASVSFAKYQGLKDGVRKEIDEWMSRAAAAF